MLVRSMRVGQEIIFSIICQMKVIHIHTGKKGKKGGKKAKKKGDKKTADKEKDKKKGTDDKKKGKEEKEKPDDSKCSEYGDTYGKGFNTDPSNPKPAVTEPRPHDRSSGESVMSRLSDRGREPEVQDLASNVQHGQLAAGAIPATYDGTMRGQEADTERAEHTPEIAEEMVLQLHKVWVGCLGLDQKVVVYVSKFA